mmetsp:Transcript_59707/g.171255  ORF Transcript_59707/g.171255 Transcript_59707/m.171255 type:complete len:205 (+) Transcript_59707:279-893(+)
MLHAVLPIALVALPPACRPVHGPEALTAVCHELPCVLDTVPPLHLALSRHAILSEVALVDGAVGPQQLALAVCAAPLEVARVLGALRPGHHALAAPHALDIVAFEHSPVGAGLAAFSVALVAPPLCLVGGAVGKCEGALPLPEEVLELPCVRRAVRVVCRAEAVLRAFASWGIVGALGPRGHDAAVLRAQEEEDGVADGRAHQC